jgi:hypothetical protein
MIASNRLRRPRASCCNSVREDVVLQRELLVAATRKPPLGKAKWTRLPFRIANGTRRKPGATQGNLGKYRSNTTGHALSPTRWKSETMPMRIATHVTANIQRQNRNRCPASSTPNPFPASTRGSNRMPRLRAETIAPKCIRTYPTYPVSTKASVLQLDLSSVFQCSPTTITYLQFSAIAGGELPSHGTVLGVPASKRTLAGSL